jgi:uracil-DNA glycosylase family 4
MKEDDVVEQTESNEDIDQVEKEAREYSQEYITELISAAKEYLPKTVWDHIHRRAVPKAGGKASGKSKRNAAAERATEADTASATVIPEVAAQLEQAQAQQTQKADDPCEVAKQKCESMKAKAAKSSEPKEITAKDIAKQIAKDVQAKVSKTKSDNVDVQTFVGSRSKLTFVAASPGIIESVRKAALVGPTGKVFNTEYLEPLGLTRDDVAILYLVPNVLKSEDGKVREPTPEEIDEWAPWFSDEWNKVIDVRSERSDATSVALGHTVKKSLSKLIDITLPHPNSLGTKRTNQELVRKMEQLKRMLVARQTGQL